MALIKCPECGKEISDKAKTCIHCGYPLIEDFDDSEDYMIGEQKTSYEQWVEQMERLHPWDWWEYIDGHPGKD